ncbi:MAG: hypothetical protein CVU22_19540 [Betaproteobacteria bacterium HGW-Betaproteobacteria-16]|nr:MAG: hypothetical protein CVU22_19540 [Betaproteobacteria bacterium HGW-Betaproteobacteria-16]
MDSSMSTAFHCGAASVVAGSSSRVVPTMSRISSETAARKATALWNTSAARAFWPCVINPIIWLLDAVEMPASARDR